MANIDLEFEEFMKEPLSTGESPDSNPSSRHDVKETLPKRRKFWWMKERPQIEKTPTEVASNRRFFSGVVSDGTRLEGGYATVSQTIKDINVAKVPATASPDISSSMADFLEKEKLCKELSNSISEVDSPAVEFQGNDVTDDEISSIMEQLSQLAGSTDDSAADKSVEEILKEAEELVRETSHSFSRFSNKSDQLKSPTTPGLVIRSMPVNPVHASIDNKHFVMEGNDEDSQSSINRPGTAPRTLTRINNKSAGWKMIDKGEQLRGSILGSVHQTSGKIDVRPGVEEISGDKFGDFRQVAHSDIHENSGARTDGGYTDVECMMSGTKSAKHLGNYSGSTNKRKDLLKKEKTVTFEDGLSLFPKSASSMSKICHSVEQSSSQKLHEGESISKKKSEASNKEDNVLTVETVTLQPGAEDEQFVRGEKHGDQHSKVLTVSPPLIQHGETVGTPDAIFQLIDSEVRSEIVAALQESQKNSSQDSSHSSLNTEKEKEEIFDHGNNVRSTMIHSLDSAGISFTKKPLSTVQEESSVSESSLGVDKLKDASTVTARKQSSGRCVQVTDTSLIEHVATLEKDLLQEQNMSLQLKSRLESGEQEHKKQLDALKCRHEEEILTLKKEVYILNAKVMDFEKGQESSAMGKGEGDIHVNDGTVREHRITLLETELQQQEHLILGYQRENIKLCQEMKQLKEKNGSLEQNAKQLKLIITTLQTELEKHKCVAVTTAAPPLKVTPTNHELDHVRKELAKKEMELEKIHKEFEPTRKEAETAKAEVAENKLQVGALEAKVSELQGFLAKERAQTRAHNLRTEEDKKKIQDLNRQVKEMEQILKRNHPDSISALILTANSEGSEASPRFKYLENRVQQLEQELSKSETDAQVGVREIQDKFHSMKLKYEEHTSDLELQLASAKHQAHMWRQAAEKNEARLAAERKAEEQPIREMKQNKKTAAPPMVITVGAPPANALAVREDAHLLATIRGLKLELAAKDKDLLKIRRDLDESTKTNRRLQRERERQLGVVAPTRPPAVRGAAKQEQVSETSQWSGNKVYDPAQFEPSIPGQKEGVERLEQENGMLREELLRLEEDYRSLQTKRLQDLNLLQKQHEAEMGRLISDHMARHSNSRIADLQGQLSTQQIIISHLKDQLKQLDEYREEIEVLRAERDHLEKSNMDLRKKVSDFRSMQTPEMLQYEGLQEKLSELERRHEAREQKLQAMVRDLLRRNTEQRAVTGDNRSATTMKEKLLDKNRQLCLYRAEMDRILETLREFNRHQKSGSTVQLAPD
ncbi:centrosomal protein of 162 kDa isoform X2 [Cryptotermes secundus]|uniref:centrosomal protein of 162 kDa isoform X2 n=1 Tax=Cryptotermes secundus TaxID=105785 RepID=UPI000CD7D188|nr:centrosomal protein of 162 kDa isoform X2 [Cryptotermes secundus]